jgi:hypothetical protein
MAANQNGWQALEAALDHARVEVVKATGGALDSPALDAIEACWPLIHALHKSPVKQKEREVSENSFAPPSPEDVVDAIRFAIAGEAPPETTVDVITEILKSAPPVNGAGTVSIDLFVNAYKNHKAALVAGGA